MTKKELIWAKNKGIDIFWADPEHKTSAFYKVDNINGSIVSMSNDFSECEAPFSEILSPKKLSGRFSVYDIGEDRLDRYTIVDNKSLDTFFGCYCAITASENGLGIFEHIEIHKSTDRRYLGKKVDFFTISTELRDMILNDFFNYNM